MKKAAASLLNGGTSTASNESRSGKSTAIETRNNSSFLKCRPDTAIETRNDSSFFKCKPDTAMEEGTEFSFLTIAETQLDTSTAIEE